MLLRYGGHLRGIIRGPERVGTVASFETTSKWRSWCSNLRLGTFNQFLPVLIVVSTEIRKLRVHNGQNNFDSSQRTKLLGEAGSRPEILLSLFLALDVEISQNDIGFTCRTL